MSREYIRKQRGKKNTMPKNADVQIHINKSGIIAGIQRYACVVSFTKDAVQKVSTTKYILASIEKKTNRLYFESGNAENGFKIACPKDCRRYYFRFTVDDPMSFVKYNGEYNLQFDEQEHIYFIEAK